MGRGGEVRTTCGRRTRRWSCRFDWERMTSGFRLAPCPIFLLRGSPNTPTPPSCSNTRGAASTPRATPRFSTGPSSFPCFCKRRGSSRGPGWGCSPSTARSCSSQSTVASSLTLSPLGSTRPPTRPKLKTCACKLKPRFWWSKARPRLKRSAPSSINSS